MAWDDPVVWILVVAVVVFLFGSNKIPQLARSIGQARREFENASKGFMSPSTSSTQPQTMPGQMANATVSPPPAYPGSQSSVPVAEDPIVIAARNEGIITEGKTRQQIASELAWKLKQKESS